MLDHMELARRFVGISEMPGHDVNSPLIMAMLTLDADWPSNDEVPWCAGYIGFVCWLAGLPRTRSLRARSWLTVGTPVDLDEAFPGDVVILNRGGPQDPTVIDAPGHVGFYVSHDPPSISEPLVCLLGGNQSNKVHESTYRISDILGVRRLI